MKECRIGGPRVDVGPSPLASRRPVYSILFPARIEKHSGPAGGRYALLEERLLEPAFSRSLWFY